jgi:pyruvate,water dikinase
MKLIASGLVASLTEQLAAGRVVGVACVISRSERHNVSRLQPGQVLVTEMTDASQEPNLLYAAAIITDRGGYTCHAALAANMFGVPCVVGAEDASLRIQDGDLVMLTPDGSVYVLDEGDVAERAAVSVGR